MGPFFYTVLLQLSAHYIISDHIPFVFPFFLPDDARFCPQAAAAERPLRALFGEGDENDGVQAEFIVSDEKFELFIIKFDMSFSVASYKIAVTETNKTSFLLHMLTPYTLSIWKSLAFITCLLQ